MGGLWAACNRLRRPGTDNPFVVGVHEPMRAELTLENLPVTGSIPLGLDGLYLKMGANPARAATRGQLQTDDALTSNLGHQMGAGQGHAQQQGADRLYGWHA
ncbi:hypothetical protein [Methylobacterium sp. GC_Met_2]|uniref:hypothetical protein n=1 Tax=Methylobacterium sp. GC_Met_2 TaxID=2937376 RepID=UPI00226B83F5|nr:hypothetical protein [Methylobacterium sp. GC_Met_2]